MDSNESIASTSRERLDSRSTAGEPEEGDMIIEEDDPQDNSGREGDFVVEEEDSEEDAVKPARKKVRMHQRLGNRRAGAGIAASVKRFTSQRHRAWSCARCAEAYTREMHLARHLIRMHLDKNERARLLSKMVCGVCGAASHRPDALKKHYMKHHANDPHPDWDDLKVFFDDFADLVLQRNSRELHNAANMNEARPQADLCLQLPFAHEKTPWTSYWPREERWKGASDEEDEADDRQWEDEDDEVYRASAKPYSDSSVARPLHNSFLPPPTDVNGTDYVFEDDGQQDDSFANVDGVAGPAVIEEDDEAPRRRRRRKDRAMVSDHESDRSEGEKSKQIRAKSTGRPRKYPPKSREAFPSNRPTEVISLTLVDSRSGRGMRFRTGKSVVLEAMVDVFATQANVDRSHLSLFFKGQPVDVKQTPVAAGMNDNELIWYDISTTPSGDVIVA